MIDVKELSVGDWVICNHYQDKPFTKQFGVADFAKGEYEFCDPIPLTSDILVKNGFKQNGVDLDVEWVLTTDTSFVILYKLPQGLFYTETSGDNILLEHIHQLQHLLRLCGIEKEIEL